MPDLSLDIARKILDAALAKVIEMKLKPMAITVLDARGCVKASIAQDGTSLMRGEIAHGKAYGALAMGMGSRANPCPSPARHRPCRGRSRRASGWCRPAPATVSRSRARRAR